MGRQHSWRPLRTVYSRNAGNSAASMTSVLYLFSPNTYKFRSDGGAAVPENCPVHRSQQPQSRNYLVSFATISKQVSWAFCELSMTRLLVISDTSQLEGFEIGNRKARVHDTLIELLALSEFTPQMRSIMALHILESFHK